MTTIAEVREAIADAVTLHSTKATAYFTDQANVPQAMVLSGEISYDDSMDPTNLYEYTVSVYATREPKPGQQYLDECAEPSGGLSIKEAIEEDERLAALVHYAVVRRALPVRQETIGETLYLARDFEVQVVV